MFPKCIPANGRKFVNHKCIFNIYILFKFYKLAHFEESVTLSMTEILLFIFKRCIQTLYGWGKTKNTKKTLSHLSAHMVNRLLRENRKTIPKFLSGKNIFKNVTLQILNFIPVSPLIKIFPIWCNVKFFCFFVLFNEVKRDTKLILHHIWRKFLLFNLSRYDLKSGGLHFFEVFYH